MLALFIPWGTDYQDQQFRAAKSFTGLWAEVKETLSSRLAFHANNFHNLRKSKEDVIADQRRCREEEEGDGNEDTSYRSDVEDGDFVVYDSEDEDEDEDSHLKGIYRRLLIAYLHQLILDATFGLQWKTRKGYLS